jgi:hypothetical protein
VLAVALLVLLATMPSVWLHAVTDSWWLVAVFWVVTVATPVGAGVLAAVHVDRLSSPLRGGIAALRAAGG